MKSSTHFNAPHEEICNGKFPAVKTAYLRYVLVTMHSPMWVVVKCGTCGQKIEKEESRIIRFHHNTEIKKYDPSSREYKVVQFRYADISKVPQDYVETTTVCLTEKCCKNMENAHGGVITGVVIPHDAHEHLGQAKYSLVKGRLQSILSTRGIQMVVGEPEPARREAEAQAQAAAPTPSSPVAGKPEVVGAKKSRDGSGIYFLTHSPSSSYGAGKKSEHHCSWSKEVNLSGGRTVFMPEMMEKMWRNPEINAEVQGLASNFINLVVQDATTQDSSNHKMRVIDVNEQDVATLEEAAVPAKNSEKQQFALNLYNLEHAEDEFGSSVVYEWSFHGYEAKVQRLEGAHSSSPRHSP